MWFQQILLNSSKTIINRKIYLPQKTEEERDQTNREDANCFSGLGTWVLCVCEREFGNKLRNGSEREIKQWEVYKYIVWRGMRDMLYIVTNGIEILLGGAHRKLSCLWGIAQSLGGNLFHLFILLQKLEKFIIVVTCTKKSNTHGYGL